MIIKVAEKHRASSNQSSGLDRYLVHGIYAAANPNVQTMSRGKAAGIGTGIGAGAGLLASSFMPQLKSATLKEKALITGAGALFGGLSGLSHNSQLRVARDANRKS